MGIDTNKLRKVSESIGNIKNAMIVIGIVALVWQDHILKADLLMLNSVLLPVFIAFLIFVIPKTPKSMSKLIEDIKKEEGEIINKISEQQAKKGKQSKFAVEFFEDIVDGIRSQIPNIKEIDAKEKCVFGSLACIVFFLIAVFFPKNIFFIAIISTVVALYYFIVALLLVWVYYSARDFK